MNPSHTPMDTDPPPPKSDRKRTASDISPPTTSSTPASNDGTPPRILRRHQHRRRNIAASLWGPDIPSTPYTSSTPTLPPPTPPFNIYKSLLRHPNLFFPLCLSLPYSSLVALYAIDKEFHYRLNKFSVSIIHDYARRHAPTASRVFTWLLFPELCISDPMLRPMDGRAWLARDVPGFRWVGMVLERQGVVRGVLQSLALEGHRVCGGVEEAVCKFWVLMEMNSARVREAFLRDAEIWRDEDLRSFGLFLVKLDMRFTDPVLGSGWCGLGHLLLTQRSLKVLWAVLGGKVKVALDYDRITGMIVQTYPTDDLDTDTFPWLDDEVDTGIPERQWGILMKERWDSSGGRMESCVDMVIHEGVRRELHIHKHLLDFVQYGHEEDAWVMRKWKMRKGRAVEMPGPMSKKASESIVQMMDSRFGLSDAKIESVNGRDGRGATGTGSDSGKGGGNGSEGHEDEGNEMDESA